MWIERSKYIAHYDALLFKWDIQIHWTIWIERLIRVNCMVTRISNYGIFKPWASTSENRKSTIKHEYPSLYRLTSDQPSKTYDFDELSCRSLSCENFHSVKNHTKCRLTHTCDTNEKKTLIFSWCYPETIPGQNLIPILMYI